MSAGAKESEVACMGSLTADLHLMMNAFYKPTLERSKILCEAKAFPSDQVSFPDSRLVLLIPTSASTQYAFASQAVRHAFDPKATILALSPRTGEYALRTDDILKIISKEGDDIAVVTHEVMGLTKISETMLRAGINTRYSHQRGQIHLCW